MVEITYPLMQCKNIKVKFMILILDFCKNIVKKEKRKSIVHTV